MTMAPVVPEGTVVGPVAADETRNLDLPDQGDKILDDRFRQPIEVFLRPFGNHHGPFHDPHIPKYSITSMRQVMIFPYLPDRK
jgi:hypothetical protein